MSLGTLWLVLPLAAVTVLSTLAGGIVALRLARELTTAIALTGGVVVAVALFHVLPEAVETVPDPRRVGLLVGLGFIVFFLAERGLVPPPPRRAGAGARARAHRRVGALGASGLAFGLDTTTGLLVFVAVAAHDFADGLNTFGFVLR